MNCRTNLTRELLTYLASLGCPSAYSWTGDWPEACGECLPCLAYDYVEQREPDTFARIRELLDRESRRASAELLGSGFERGSL